MDHTVFVCADFKLSFQSNNYQLYEFHRATIAKCRAILNCRKLLFHSRGVQKSKIKGSEGSALSRGSEEKSIPCFLLALVMTFGPSSSLVCVCTVSTLAPSSLRFGVFTVLHKDTSHTGLGAHPTPV